jgi:PAS domain S-box-containing protein
MVAPDGAAAYLTGAGGTLCPVSTYSGPDTLADTACGDAHQNKSALVGWPTPPVDGTAVRWGDASPRTVEDDVDGLKPFASSVRAAGFSTWATMPLVGHRGSLGVVAVYWSTLRPVSTPECLVLEAAGRQVGATLEYLQRLDEQRQHEAVRAQLAAVVDLSDDAVIGINADGFITTWNGAAQRLFGHTAEAAIGQHCSLLVPPGLDGELPMILRRIAQGEHIDRYETRRVRSDGVEFQISMSAAPAFDSHGCNVGAMFLARDVTEHRKAEQAHGDLLVRERAAREQLDAILGGVADGVIVQQENGSVIFANDAAARIAGFETADAYLQATAFAVSMSLSTLDADGQPFDLDQLPARRAFRGEATPDMVVQFRRAGTNDLRWSRTQSRIVRGVNGERLAISIFQDITDEVRSQARLRFLAEAGAQLAGPLDRSKTLDALVRVATTTLADWAIILLTDDDGNVQHIASSHRDPEKAALTRELHGQRLKHASGVTLLWKALQKREPLLIPVVTDETMVAYAQNAEHLALLRALSLSSLLYAPLVHDGRVQGAIALFMSGSGRHFGDEDRAIAVEIARRASLALENARLYEAANAAVQARDEFLSIASHELRTPVTAISGIAQVALRSKQRGALDDARLTRVLEQLIRGSQRLVTLTEDLLDVSRLQTGRFDLRPEPLDVSAFVTDFADRFGATLAEAHHLTLHVESSGLVVRADPARLEQVLANLLNNAVKYSPHGGMLTVSVSRDDERATVAVQDEGIGVPPGTAETIFQPFGRAPNAAHRQIQGLGLGLYICRQIMERHGGGIRAESDGDGCGTTMRFWLPLATEQAGC